MNVPPEVGPETLRRIIAEIGLRAPQRQRQHILGNRSPGDTHTVEPEQLHKEGRDLMSHRSPQLIRIFHSRLVILRADDRDHVGAAHGRVNVPVHRRDFHGCGLGLVHVLSDVDHTAQRRRVRAMLNLDAVPQQPPEIHREPGNPQQHDEEQRHHQHDGSPLLVEHFARSQHGLESGPTT